MKKRRLQTSIIFQVTNVFVACTLLVGVLSFFSQRSLAKDIVNKQAEALASKIAWDTELSVVQHPAYEWLINYWHDHAGKLDIEYDVDYYGKTITERRAHLFRQRNPDVDLDYSDVWDIYKLSDPDKKIFSEIVYSWLITRVNQIKAAYGVDFLFCVISDPPHDKQFFVFSAGDGHTRRGTEYEEIYELGVVVDVGEDQQKGMVEAKEFDEYLASAGDYVDYYSYLGKVGYHDVFIGITYKTSILDADISEQTWRGTWRAVLFQVGLIGICLVALYLLVLRPLTKVQQNIRLYKDTKDSKVVTTNLSRVHSRNEIGRLSEDVSALAYEMDDYMGKIEQVSAERERIVTELSVASRIQAQMLPSEFPPFPENKEFDIFASMDPAKEVGGDYYDYFKIDDDHLALLIADVSGKGVPAALFMMVSMALIQNAARQNSSPAEILRIMNDQICARNPEEMFVSVWLGVLEISTGRMKAANAGHEYPFLIHKDGRAELLKQKHGVVIGAMSGMTYNEYEVQLQPGDRFFIYTDGVPEATAADNSMFGMERLEKTLNEIACGKPEEVLSIVRKAVDEFVQEAVQFDDLTMLCLAYHGAREGEDGREDKDRQEDGDGREDGT